MTVDFVGAETDYTGSGGTVACVFQNSDSTMPTVTAGQMLVVIIGWGNIDGVAPTAPAGWNFIDTVTGGAGAYTAEDSGSRGLSVWYRIATGAENGSTYTFPSPTVNTTNRVIWGYLFRFSKTLTYWNTPVMTAGSDDASGSNYSAAMNANQGATTGDLAIAATATNPSATNHTIVLAWTGTNGGATTLANLKTGQSTSGYNVRTNARYRQITGTSTAVGVISSGSDVIGPGVLIRLRDTNTAPNIAPVADAGPDATVEPYLPFTLDGTGSTDTEGTIASYSWAQVGTNTGTVTISNGSTASASAVVVPTVVADEDYTFRLTVTDSGGLTDTSDVVITVLRSSESAYHNGARKPVRITSA